MLIITDSLATAQTMFEIESADKSNRFTGFKNIDKRLIDNIFADQDKVTLKVGFPDFFRFALVTRKARSSQYDLLVKLARIGADIPDRLICLAGEGGSFHGFKDRQWAAPPGNIYLSVVLKPDKIIEHYGQGFIVLAAVSVVDTIDSIGGLRGKAQIKWVNDILIENSKVCGVLASTQAEDNNVTGAVLGVGVNVTASPEIESTPYVPDAACLNDFMTDDLKVSIKEVLPVLMENIAANYDSLLAGDYKKLLDKYRNRSAVIGKDVTITDDSDDDKIIAEGEVSAIGEGLELHMKGCNKPITLGRLILHG